MKKIQIQSIKLQTALRLPSILGLVLGLLLSVPIWAQPGPGGRGPGGGGPGPARERIQQYKEQYIREALVLSDEDAKKFFPIYNQYEEEKRGLRMQEAKLKRGFMAKTDAQLATDLETLLKIKEEDVALERTYMKKFMSVLTARQVAALYHAESQFRRKLLERFGELDQD